jgi:Toprim domain-containing protein/CHC2-type zinc finger protein
MIPAEAIDRAAQADILAVAHDLGARLKRVGAASPEYYGPCPHCGGVDRFSLNVRKQVWNCRGCDKGGRVIDLLIHVDGLTFVDAVETLAKGTWERRPPRKQAGEDKAARNGENAMRIWRGAQPIGPLARTYLGAVRKIDIDQIPDINSVLRFEPRCPFGERRLPCLITLVRAIATNEPMAIQRTALDAHGRFIDRWGLGPKMGGAIKLWPAASPVARAGLDACPTLIVGEGMETTASAATRISWRGASLQPAWALIDRVNLAALPVIDGVERLVVLVDRDKSGDGQKAAATCARRWRDARRDAWRLTPDEIGDFNDLVLRLPT